MRTDSVKRRRSASYFCPAAARSGDSNGHEGFPIFAHKFRAFTRTGGLWVEVGHRSRQDGTKISVIFAGSRS